MKQVKRIDFFDASEFRNAERTDQGFLKAPMYATRTGVFEYLMPDGTIRRELRPEEEVFNQDSLNTLSQVPITMLHPTEMVDPFNARDLTVGFTGEKVDKAEDIYVKVNGVVTDAEAINTLLSGQMREVSCGYRCDMDFTGGEWNGQKYDAIQRNIRYNHVAIVDMGRAGDKVKFKLDRMDGIEFNSERRIDINQGEKPMSKITIDGKEFEVSEAVEVAFTNFTKQNKKDSDDLNQTVKTLTEEKDKFEAKADTLSEKVDSLEKEVKEANEKFDNLDLDTMIGERNELIEKAVKVIGEEFKADGMKNEEIVKAIVAHKAPSINLEEKSDAYIEARFDAICEGLEEEKNDDKDDLEDKIENHLKEDKKDKKPELKEWEQPLAYSAK